MADIDIDTIDDIENDENAAYSDVSTQQNLKNVKGRQTKRKTSSILSVDKPPNTDRSSVFSKRCKDIIFYNVIVRKLKTEFFLIFVHFKFSYNIIKRFFIVLLLFKFIIMFFYKIVANCVRSTEQLHSSKKQFNYIPEKQADAMTVREKSEKPRIGVDIILQDLQQYCNLLKDYADAC